MTKRNFLGNLEKLTKGFYLDRNSLSDIPSQLGRLVGMTSTLALSENDIAGSVPTEIGQLHEMTADFILREVRWNLTDPTITSSLNDVPPIAPRRLQNLISKALPTQLGQLSNARRDIYLDSNRLVSTVPTQLALVRVMV